jgi:putative tryptophan/tyrosine transport system substrate-binding protein
MNTAIAVVMLFLSCLMPFAAEAQQSPRTMPLVGALYPGDPSASISVDARAKFQQGLRENGYVQGQNIALAERYAKNPDEITRALKELIDLRVAAMMVVGTQASLAAKRATSSIPIVSPNMANPVADGLVASLARPEGNLTGNAFLGPELDAKRFELLKELIPGMARIAGLRHLGVYSERTMQNMVMQVEERAKKNGIELKIFDVRSPSDFDAAFDAMVKAHMDGLFAFSSPMFYVNHQRLVDLAAMHKVPTTYSFREAVEAGGLLSYGADIPDNTRRAAIYIAKILNGTKPADLPVEQPTRFELVINLKTAKALGLTVPKLLLARADKVLQ